MRWVINILLTLCLLAPVASGQPATGRPNDGQAALIDRISTTRLALERIEDAADIVRSQRDVAAQSHESGAAEIRQIKSANKDAGLLPNFELQRKLRRSQELAETLTLLNRELQALQQARLDRLQQLALAYEKLIQQTAGQAKSTSGQRQADQLALLDQARRELAGIQQQLTPAPRAPREIDGAQLLASDDPEELAERADEVRDEQDRLRKELAQLDSRLRQQAREARLDREMRDFILEQEIFDEGSRVLLVPRGPSALGGAEGAKTNGDPADPGRTDSIEGDNDASPSDEPPGGYSDGALSGGEAPGSGSEPNASSSDLGLDASTTGGRLPDGVAQDQTPAAGPGSRDALQTIEQKRGQIVERLKRLQRLHDRLQEKIEDLERE